jgi:murein DD-endopeptidase MepM/ murein hydrolase activator NlpD
MAAGSVSSTSTYVEGKTFSFAKTVASKVLDAAKAAKNVKHKHDAMERRGKKIPEAEKKGIFARALKEQFVKNPIKDLKKSLGKKTEKGAGIIGLFGKKGRVIERNILAANKKYFGTKKKRTGGGGMPAGAPTSGGGGGIGGDFPLTAIGSIVVDIEQIASSLSSLTQLFNTNLGLTYKLSGGLAEIKNILTEQLSIQRGAILDDEMRAKEAALENSQQNAGSAKSTSTIREGGILDGLMSLLNIPKALQNLTGFITRIPAMLKGLISRLPGGQLLLKGASKAGGLISGAVQGAKGFMKGGIMKFLRPVFKRIPIFGGLLDFAISLALGEPVGRAAAKAVGATLGAGLGTLIPVPGVATIAGGVLGDWVGGTLYDLIAGKGSEQKMSEGGVMIGEAGPEMVTSLDSTMGKGMMSGNESIQDAYNQPYNAVAGGMLAVTKDFVEGLGPIGASVAPVIQDDVDKLGRVFDIPASNVNIQVGGESLRKNPLAEKEGKKYMEQLVQGSLEKIAPKKENAQAPSGGGGGGGGGSPSSTSDTPSEGTPAAPAGAPAQPQLSSGEQTLNSLRENTKFVNKEQKGLFGQTNVINAVSGTDKAGVRRVKMVDEDGKLSDRYYYNANGDIFSVDPSLGTRGISQLTPDMIKSGLGSKGRFYRNLQTGQVVVTNRPPVGYYNYEKHGVVQESLAQAKSNAVNMEMRTVKTKPISSLTDVERQNFGSSPYGPVADISKIKAEKGIVVSSRRGMRSHPVSGGYKMHQGTDISAPQGTKLYAFTDGRVEDVKKEGKGDAGYGNSVYWVDDRGLGHLYAHLHQFGKGITPGAEFKKGKLLGSVGSTGISTGPHLHWELGQNPADVGRSGRSLIDPLSKYDYMSPFRGTAGPGDGLTGDVPGDNTSGEYSDREEAPEDPFEAMDKAIKGMATGLGLMLGATRGEIKTKEDFDRIKTQLESAASSSSPSTTQQKTEDKATSPQHFHRPGGGEATPTASSPTPAKPAAAPAAAATDRTVAAADASKQLSIINAPQMGGAQMAAIPASKPEMTPAGLSDFSYPTYSSTAVKYNPLASQFAHLS